MVRGGDESADGFAHGVKLADSGDSSAYPAAADGGSHSQSTAIPSGMLSHGYPTPAGSAGGLPRLPSLRGLFEDGRRISPPPSGNGLDGPPSGPSSQWAPDGWHNAKRRRASPPSLPSGSLSHPLPPPSGNLSLSNLGYPLPSPRILGGTPGAPPYPYHASPYPPSDGAQHAYRPRAVRDAPRYPDELRPAMLSGFVASGLPEYGPAPSLPPLSSQATHASASPYPPHARPLSHPRIIAPSYASSPHAPYPSSNSSTASYFPAPLRRSPGPLISPPHASGLPHAAASDEGSDTRSPGQHDGSDAAAAEPLSSSSSSAPHRVVGADSIELQKSLRPRLDTREGTPACDECRRRKVKCDRKQPCTRCVTSKRNCSTSDTLMRRGPLTRQQKEIFAASGIAYESHRERMKKKRMLNTLAWQQAAGAGDDIRMQLAPLYATDHGSGSGRDAARESHDDVPRRNGRSDTILTAETDDSAYTRSERSPPPPLQRSSTASAATLSTASSSMDDTPSARPVAPQYGRDRSGTTDSYYSRLPSDERRITSHLYAGGPSYVSKPGPPPSLHGGSMAAPARDAMQPLRSTYSEARTLPAPTSHNTASRSPLP